MSIKLPGSFWRYILIAGLALISRIILTVFTVESIHPSQTATLAWPVLVTAMIVGYPAVHFAEQWANVSPSPSMQEYAKTVLWAFLLGLVLAILLIYWDLLFSLPDEMHVTGNFAIPFYFTGAFLVETLQHVIPLCIWLGIAGQLVFRGKHISVVFWVGAILVAFIEPASQLGGTFLAGYPAAFYWTGAIVIYAINLSQMFVFRRAGFIPMLAVRLGMYAVWHILWGSLQLP